MGSKLNRFVITKGYDNTFVFTIKEDGATTPMLISGSDSFLAKLINIDPELTQTPVISKYLTVDGSNADGRVKLSISATETAAVATDKGPAVDRFYNRPTYKLILDCNTSVNGNFIAKVANVYVD